MESISHGGKPRQSVEFPFYSAATIEAITSAKQVYVVPDEADAAVLYDVLDIPALGVPRRHLAQLPEELIAGAEIIYTFLSKSAPDVAYKLELALRLKALHWPGLLKVAPLEPELPIQNLWKYAHNRQQEAEQQNVRRARDGEPLCEVDSRGFETSINLLLAQVATLDIRRLSGHRRGAPPPEASPARTYPRLDDIGYTLRDLQHRDIPELQWAIEDLLPEGLALMAGPPGLGKSMLLLQVSLAVALGGMLLDVWPAAQGDVLYIGTEDNDRRVEFRTSQLLADDQGAAVWPASMTVVHDIQSFDAGLIEQLEEWLTAHPQARLVIIDIFADVKPPRAPHSDWYMEERRMGRALDALAMRHHVCILVSLHTNRLQHAEDPIDRVHGGSGLPGAAPTKTVLLSSQGFNKAVWHTRGRDTAREQHALAMVEGIWRYSGDWNVLRLSEERQAILRYCQFNPGPHTAQEVAQTLGKNPVTVGLLLRKLRASGLLHKVGYGKYQYGEEEPHNSSQIGG